MYFGNGGEWFRNLLEILFENQNDLEINITHHENNLHIYCSAELNFGLSKEFPFFITESGEHAKVKNNELMFLLVASDKSEFHCSLEEHGKCCLRIEQDNVSVEKSGRDGFSVEFNFGDLSINILKLTHSRLISNLSDWLIFHPSVSINYYSSTIKRNVFLSQPKGTEVLFERLLERIPLNHEPFRAEVTVDNVKVKLIVGFHSQRIKLVNSYVNGILQESDEGIQLKVLDKAISKIVRGLQIQPAGNYLALILMDLPENEIEWQSPCRNFKFINETVFRLIDEVITNNLSDYVNRNEKLFLPLK